MRHLCLLLFIVATTSLATAQDLTGGLLDAINSNVDIEGLETSFDPETGIFSAKGNVHINYGDTEIRAGEANYNAATGDVIAKNNVTVSKAGALYQGDHIVYNVKNNELSGSGMRSGMQHQGGQLFYSMDSFETETRQVEKVEGTGAFFTTHDLANPNYKLKAKKITIYPDDRVVMKQVTVYAGKTPVLWLPYVSQPLNDEVGYSFSPGYSKNWGAFLLNRYGVIYGDHTLATYHVDLRSTRGLAGGVELESMRYKGENDNLGKLNLYFANDSDPLVNQANEERTDVDTNRYRVNFQHRIYITGPAERTWYLDFDVNKMSDEFFYEDFFLEEYSNNREPDNQVSLVRSDPRYTATLMAKFQLNDFYRTDTRLPEIAFDFTRQPILGSGFYYQGATSWGLLKEKRGSVEKDQTEATKDAAEAALKAFDAAEADGTAGDPLEGIEKKGIRSTLGLDPDAEFGRDEVEQALTILQTQLGDSSFSRVHSYHEVLYPKQLLVG